MFKLLNRFAWILSLSFGFIIAFIVIGFSNYKIGSEEIFFSFILGIIFGLIIKNILFSKTFIQNRLEFFANSLKQNYLKSKEEIKEDVLEKTEKENINILDKQEKTKENKILEEKVENLTNSQNYTESKKPTVIEKFFNKTTNYIKDFFSTNLLAKLGGILVFLAVVYFLKGAAVAFWEFIGPVGRIAIGIFIGFATYLVGVKIHNKYNREGIILMGTGILINFAVILAGRYLVGGDGYLTETTTFLFLILNTIFGILTSLIYKSKTLLLFSFIFAYLNPFIIGAESNGQPYTLVGYSLIVSLGALFISQKQNSTLLFIISFLAGNFLLLVAPTSDSIGEITKIIALNIYNAIAIYNASKLTDKYKLALEITFGLVFLIIASYLATINYQILGDNSLLYITSISSSLFLLVYSYILSFKKPYLFSIGTAGTILTLAPLVVVNLHFEKTSSLASIPTNTLEFYLGISAIIVFAIINLALPFINKNLLKKDSLSNLVFGVVLGAMFFAFQIYNFGEVYYPGTIEGFAFLALAMLYFFEGYLMGEKLGFENIKKDENLKNIFYTFMGLSIALFSISVTFVFSDYPDIITTTWLFEATILYFFYSKTGSLKIFTAATILFIIGLTKFGILFDVVSKGDFKFLISFVIILASFILNLYFINKAENTSLPSSSLTGKRSLGFHNIHHFFHLFGMAIMGGLLFEIIPSTGHGWSMLAISIFISFIGSFYARFNFKFLKIAFVIVLGFFAIAHIGLVSSIFWKLGKDDLQYLKILQYIVSIIIISNYFIWNFLQDSKNGINKVLLAIVGVYVFIISNFYILDLFENIFGYYTLTIYWGLIASSLLVYGIQKDVIKYRTIGLYFLSLTSAKIFLYDVWQIGDTDSRIAVFAILGVIFIIISTLYTKRFGDNMKGEFSLSNLKSETKVTKG